MPDSYSLDNKIIAYLEKNGVPGARVADMTIIIPLPNGELHRSITGVVTHEKLDKLIAEYNEMANA